MNINSILFAALLCFTTTGYAQQRVISAGANITEIVIALDASEQLVGVDSTSRSLVDASMPIVGYHRALASEGLLSLSPTLLLGSQEMGPQTSLEQLDNAGVVITSLSSHLGVEGLYERISQTSEVLDSQVNGQKLLSQVKQQYQKIEQQRQLLKQQQQRPMRAMFVMSSDGRKMTVAGDKTVVSELLELAGIEHVTAGHFSSYKPLSAEAILELQPDMILISKHSLAKLGGEHALLNQQPLLAHTPAGQEQRIVSFEGRALIGGVGLETLDLAQHLIALQQQEL